MESLDGDAVATEVGARPPFEIAERTPGIGITVAPGGERRTIGAHGRQQAEALSVILRPITAARQERAHVAPGADGFQERNDPPRQPPQDLAARHDRQPLRVLAVRHDQ